MATGLRSLAVMGAVTLMAGCQTVQSDLPNAASALASDVGAPGGTPLAPPRPAAVRRLTIDNTVPSVPLNSDELHLGKGIPSVSTMADPMPRYQIQPGDILETRFSDTDLNQQMLVDPEGHVNIVASGDVFAAGLNIEELRNKLKSRAKIIDPNFDLALRSSVGTRIYVTGEVNTSGEIVSNGRISAIQAISRAGGLKLDAQDEEVVLIRHDADYKAHVYTMDIKAAMNGSQPGQDIWLQPYDIVYVPRDRVGNVSLVFERLRNAIPFVFSFVYGKSFVENTR